MQDQVIVRQLVLHKEIMEELDLVVHLDMVEEVEEVQVVPGEMVLVQAEEQEEQVHQIVLQVHR